MVETNQKVLIQRLKDGDEATLRYIYEENKGVFINFLRRYRLDTEDLLDIYQDAVIVLFENAKRGKLDDIKSTISTYLIGIGKYMAMNKNKKKQRTIVDSDTVGRQTSTLIVESVDEYEDVNSNRAKSMKMQFEKLGSTCREILALFYYEGYTIQEIMEIMGYHTENVAKATKSRCLRKLKTYVNEN